MKQLCMYENATRNDSITPVIEGLSECRFPSVAATTGYRYGCRCGRCTEAKKAANGNGAPAARPCREAGCTNQCKTGGAFRYCAYHVQVRAERKVCAVHGCEGQRRLIHGSMYCEEHGRVIGGTRQVNRNVVAVVRCPVCEAVYGRSKNSKHPFCPACNDQYRGAINSALRHGATTDQLLNWVRLSACDLCGTRLNMGERTSNHAAGPNVDHDHNHCRGNRGCAECIRGMLCTRCNTALGGLEALLRVAGSERLARYLKTTKG